MVITDATQIVFIKKSAEFNNVMKSCAMKSGALNERWIPLIRRHEYVMLALD